MTALTRNATLDHVSLPSQIDWSSVDEEWYTARVLGDYPATLKRWHGDADEELDDQRAEILFELKAGTLDRDVPLIYDTHSGAVFEFWTDQPCGGGCRCAVTIVWRPEVTAPDA